MKIVQPQEPWLEPRRDFAYVGLAVLAFIVLAPLFILAFNALKDPAEIGRNPARPSIAPQFF